MNSLWTDEEAAQYQGDLGLRVYTSRLLGRDSTLVMHGGGNTSVKIRERDILGHEQDILYVKGSGWDLETIEEAGFAPVQLDHLIRLAGLDKLSDPQMVNQLKTHMTVASAPTPSVEAILHAILPYKYVDHTHADAVITVTNTAGGKDRVREIYGDRVVIIPYTMPGFGLARLCAKLFPDRCHEGTIGMVLMNHGIFSFADDARQSYERMVDLVDAAEKYLRREGAWVTVGDQEMIGSPIESHKQLAELRRTVSQVAGSPMIMACHRQHRHLEFVRRSDVQNLSQQGPATPDHVIRTKRLPLVGRDVDAYVHAYREYFRSYSAAALESKEMLDPAPRVILDSEFGMCALGRRPRDAAIVADIYEHTMDIILRATALGGYQALPAGDIFDVEYWDLEQAKLRRAGTPPPLSGEIVIITGVASGIGRACVDAFLRCGAAVIGVDIDAAVEDLHKRPEYLGIVCDVTDDTSMKSVMQRGIEAFGGIDMAVLNAGIFPESRSIAEIDNELWNKVLEINLTANLRLMRELHPYLKLAPGGGRVVVIGSKNVPAPGPGAAAYSASKAALTQLARVAALEWGNDGIRINVLHPDAVFDTAIWKEEVLEKRARAYGISVAEYKKKNVMHVEVASRDVAELAAEVCGPLFNKTTGAQIPIDGGNERVI